MALLPNQVAVGSSQAAALVTVPPGPCTVVIVNDASSTGPVYIGTSSAVTTGNGYPLDAGAGPVTLQTYKTSSGGTLYGICASTKSATVGIFLSTGA